MAKHAQLRLHAPRYLWGLVESLPEVGVEDQFDRVLSKIFPANPHERFGTGAKCTYGHSYG